MGQASKILRGFKLFEDKKVVEPSNVFVSIHHGKRIQLSKGLIDLLGLDKKQYYTSLYYSDNFGAEKTGAVGMGFSTSPTAVKAVITRYGEGKRLSSGAVLCCYKFCEFHKIPVENQTLLPVTKIDQENKVIVVQLRKVRNMQAISRGMRPPKAPPKTSASRVPVARKMVSSVKRAWEKRQPPRQVLIKEVTTVLEQADRPLITKDIALILFNRSVITSMDYVTLNRISEVLHALGKAGKVKFTPDRGTRYYSLIDKS